VRSTTQVSSETVVRLDHGYISKIPDPAHFSQLSCDVIDEPVIQRMGARGP
jgi:hypothetical protein